MPRTGIDFQQDLFHELGFETGQPDEDELRGKTCFFFISFLLNCFLWILIHLFAFRFEISSLRNTAIELHDGLSASPTVPEHVLLTLLSTLWWLSLYITWTPGGCRNNAKHGVRTSH